MNQKKIGQFIKERRKEKKLTQEELADKLRVSNRTISKWENGNSIPDYSIINDLCTALDVSINELLSGERVNKEDYQRMFEANVLKTIKYNNKKIITAYIRGIVVFIVVLVLCLYFGYKSMLFKQLHVDNYIDYNESVKPITYILDEVKSNVEPNNKVTYYNHDIEFYLDPSYEITNIPEEGAELFSDTYIKKVDGNRVGRYKLEAYSGPTMYDDISEADINYETSLRLQKKYGIYNIVDYFEYYYNMKPVNYLSSIDDIYMYVSASSAFSDYSYNVEVHGVKGDIYGLYTISKPDPEESDRKSFYVAELKLYNLERNASLTVEISIDDIAYDDFKQEVENFVHSVNF
jgi:transcriptional regulator with XRE-family HTH domain